MRSLSQKSYTESEQILKQQIVDQLYLCSKENYPGLTEDLIMTGAHSVLVTMLHKAKREKVEGILGKTYTIRGKYRLPVCLDERSKIYDKRGTFTIYHLALENESDLTMDGIYANGLLVESCSKQYLRELSNMTLFE